MSVLAALVLIASQAGSGASATPPRPVDRRSWVTAGDYPVAAASTGTEGDVRVRLTVDPEGRVFACEIERPAGAELDGPTCALLMARARFQPSRDAAGRAVASTYSTTIAWRLPANAVPVVPFAPAQTIVETTVGSIRPFHCRVRTSGRPPRAFAWNACAPNAGATALPPPPRFITRATSMLLPEGQRPSFPINGVGRLESEARIRIEVSPAGVVMLCEPLGRPDRTGALGVELVCEGMQVAGAPSFPPATGDARRVAEIRIIRTSDFERSE